MSHWHSSPTGCLGPRVIQRRANGVGPGRFKHRVALLLLFARRCFERPTALHLPLAALFEAARQPARSALDEQRGWQCCATLRHVHFVHGSGFEGHIGAVATHADRLLGLYRLMVPSLLSRSGRCPTTILVLSADEEMTEAMFEVLGGDVGSPTDSDLRTVVVQLALAELRSRGAALRYSPGWRAVPNDGTRPASTVDRPDGQTMR